MPKPLKPAPHPWRKEDHQGKGIKIVAADGSTVALLHYPTSPTEATNLELILRAPILMERMKSLLAFCSGLKLFGQPGKTNPTLVSAEALIREIEIVAPPEKPKEPEVL